MHMGILLLASTLPQSSSQLLSLSKKQSVAHYMLAPTELVGGNTLQNN